jgi:hypothetical protein
METVGDVILFINPLYLVIGIVYVLCLALPSIHDFLNIPNKSSKLDTTRETTKHISILGLSFLICLIIILVFLFVIVFIIVAVRSKNKDETFFDYIINLLGNTKDLFNRYFWNNGNNAYAYMSIIWCFVVLMLMFIFYSLANKDFAKSLYFPNQEKDDNVKHFHKHFLLMFFICFIFSSIITVMSIQKKIPVIFIANICLLFTILIFGIASFAMKKLIIIPAFFILLGYGITLTPHFVS